MVIYKNGTIISNSAFPNTDFCGDADFVIPDDSELAKKISAIKSNVRLIFDDNGQPVDAVETDPIPLPVTLTDHDRLVALEQAFMEFVAGGLGATLSPKLKDVLAQIKNNNLEED